MLRYFLIVVGLSCGQVLAEGYPDVRGWVVIEGIYERSIEYDADSERLYSLDFTLGLEGLVAFSKPLSLEIETSFEPVGLDQGRDYFFYVEWLSLNYDQESWGVSLGKFNPKFGLAPDILFGGYAAAMLDYEVEEKIGFSGHYILADGIELVGSGFFADTTVLGRTYLNKTEWLRLEDGGVSNTEDFSSYTMGLVAEGGRFEGHLGYALQAAGVGDEEDEQSIALGLGYDFGDNISIMPVAEIVLQEGVEGVRGLNGEYLTLGMNFEWGDAWDAGVSKTWRWTQGVDEDEVGNWLVQAGVTYRFDEAVSLEFGWSRRQEEGVRDQLLGVLFVYEKAF